MPVITVELYGIPRLRAGVAEVPLVAESLGDALDQLDRQIPRLELLTEEGRLAAHYRISLDGLQFLDAPSTPLQEGWRLLLLSADVGG